MSGLPTRHVACEMCGTHITCEEEEEEEEEEGRVSGGGRQSSNICDVWGMIDSFHFHSIQVRGNQMSR